MDTLSWLNNFVMAFRCRVIPFETNKKGRLFDKKESYVGLEWERSGFGKQWHMSHFEISKTRFRKKGPQTHFHDEQNQAEKEFRVSKEIQACFLASQVKADVNVCWIFVLSSKGETFDCVSGFGAGKGVLDGMGCREGGCQLKTTQQCSTKWEAIPHVAF